VAERLGSVRARLAVGGLIALLALVGLYWFVVRQDTAEPRVLVPQLTATIGEGEEAIGVSAEGRLVRWLPLPEDPPLPRLPLDQAPKGGRVKGPALEQVRVLAAAPAALRPYLESSDYGENGVDVTLTTGIELGFGDSSQAKRKWRAAAAVLADPAVTAVDYVDLKAPRRPSYDGEEHQLPPLP
jgi:cell division septal protein FtsQ